jgi:dTDP-4-amino-4,6-dideoxy-D-galactose acyltransferase
MSSPTTIAACTPLAWDTEFWGVQIGRGTLPVQEAHDCAQALGLDCLYLLIPIDEMEEAHEAVRLGFRLTDVRVQFELEPRAGHSYTREHEDTDLPVLAELARSSFRGTRFYNDPRFPDWRCDDLYETWTLNSCAGEATVFVAEREQRVCGYVTVTEEGEVGLIAVAREARQQGVGRDLMVAALDWAFAQGLPLLTVVTQGGNLPAQRLFQGAGARSKTVGLWFHKWFDA